MPTQLHHSSSESSFASLLDDMPMEDQDPHQTIIQSGNVLGYLYPAWILTAQNSNGGLHALQAVPMSMNPQFHGGLVPISYNVPSSDVEQNSSSPNDQRSGRRHQLANEEREAMRDNIQRQRLLRLLAGYQIGLLLVLKLSVIFFVFDRAGSRDKLRLMMFLNVANLVYLYRIGAFDPLLRWLSNGARRVMIPANTPTDQAATPTEHAGTPTEHADDVQHNVRADNSNEHRVQQFRWQGFTKEFQMIVVGFVASLFPGFRFNDQI